MKILLVYPEYPDTFWSFRYALKFVSTKAPFPPLGLLTVATMLPEEWEKKLTDMNVNTLSDEDIKWADYIFISAMEIQKKSVTEIVDRCQKLGAKTVAGGPLFSTGFDEFDGVDHLVLNEAEITLPLFLADLEKGRAQHIYTSSQQPDISKTPVPLWSLINMSKYSSMSIQYSRGCPFDCEFCDIVVLNGHRPRTKNKEQIGSELETLYNHGWRGKVFIVDDNFIGNKSKLKSEILPTVTSWSKTKKYPFDFNTEASINLADDEKLLHLMVEAGFNRVFIGIETPNEESLTECNKLQNKGRDLSASVKIIQNTGLEVQGGFIVGFDNDPLSIFKSQINFIQRSGIVTAMVGLLNAPRGTRLYERLQQENRLINGFTGDNTDCSLNFIPKMNSETLINGYKQILNTIYSPGQYYDRIKTFLKEYRPQRKRKLSLEFNHVKGLIKTIWFLGIKDKGRKYYWKLLLSSLFKHPQTLHLSLSFAVYGFHFRKVMENYINKPMKDILRYQMPQKQGDC